MKTIMIVDDDPDITLLVKTKLEKTGRFRVVATNEGRKAAALAREAGPDLIICDIDMPDKYGGDVAMELSEGPDTGHIPILFFSSLASPGDIHNGKVGGRDMVSKASPIDELIRRVDGMLETP